MYAGYLFPSYRSWYPPVPWGYWGYWGSGYPVVNTGSNIIGSAIANQSLINTGSLVGTVTQTATPTVIW